MTPHKSDATLAAAYLGSLNRGGKKRLTPEQREDKRVILAQNRQRR